MNLQRVDLNLLVHLDVLLREKTSLVQLSSLALPNLR